MRTRVGLVVVVTLLFTLPAAPRGVQGNAAGVQFLLLDDEGEMRHVVPRSGTGVRMVAERVVLIPYLDPTTKRAHVLVSGRYDLLSKRSHRHFPVGYPEIKGAYQHSVHSNYLKTIRKLKQRQPTIWQLSASINGRPLTVRAHPGVARYRRWFTFGVSLPARKQVRLRVRYLARVGRSLRVYLTDMIGFRFPGLYTWADYWIDYVLHTGSAWDGPIGRGEVLLFTQGQLHTLKRFKNLRPTRKDDLTVRLPLGGSPCPRRSRMRRTTSACAAGSGGGGSTGSTRCDWYKAVPSGRVRG